MNWHTLKKWLLGILAFCIIVIAVLVSLARGLNPYLRSHHQAFATWLSVQTKRDIHFKKIEASWHGWHPVIVLTKVTIDNHHQPWLHIGKISLGLQLFQSLRNRQVVITRLWFANMPMVLAHDKRGSLLINYVKWHPQKGSVLKSTYEKIIRHLGHADGHVDFNVVSSELYFKQNKVTQARVQFQAQQVNIHYPAPVMRHPHKQGGNHFFTDDFRGVCQWRHHSLGCDVSSNNTTLLLPNDYTHVVTLKKITFHLRYTKQAQQVTLALSPFNISDGNVSLHGALRLKKEAAMPFHIDLHSHIDIQHPQQITDSLPSKRLNTHLIDWLKQAIRQAGTVHGHLSWVGNMDAFPYRHGHGQFKLVLPMRQVNLHFAAGWPALKALNCQLVFDNQGMSIDDVSAKFVGHTLNHLQAKIVDYMQAKPILLIATSISTTLPSAKNIVSQSPLKASLGKDLAWFHLKGKTNLQLQLSITLGAHHHVSVYGRIPLKAAHIQMVQAPLVDITHLTGDIQFTNQRVEAKSLQGRLLGKVIHLNLHTISIAGNKTRNKKTKTLTRVAFHGQLSLLSLLTVLGNKKWNQFLKGQVAYHGQLDLQSATSRQASTVSIDSDLVGLDSHCLAPFNKLAKQAWPFHLRLDIPKHQPWRLLVTLDHDWRMIFLPKQAHMKQHTLFLAWGAAKVPKRLPSGTTLLAKVKQLNLATWIALYRQLKPMFSHHKKIAPMLLHIQAAQGVYHRWQVKHILLAARHRQQHWHVSMDSPNLKGVLDWFVQHKKKQVNIDIKQANVSEKKIHSDKHQSAKSVSKKQHWDFTSYPEIRFHCQACRLQHQWLGTIDLTIDPMSEHENGLMAKNIRIHNQFWQYQGDGQWLFDAKQGETKTHIEGRLQTNNVANSLQALQIPLGLSGKKGRCVFDFYWDGNPFPINLKSLRGEAYLGISEGQVTDIGKGAEAKIRFGKLLNFLSIQSISKKLLLDFSDIRSQGFPFDSLKAVWRFKQGNAVSNDVTLIGSVASVYIKGRVGLLDKHLDLHVRVYPKVTSSLPVIATIAGGPIAGVVAWFANKAILSPVVGHMAESKYHVIGTWHNPKIIRLNHPAKPIPQNDRLLRS